MAIIESLGLEVKILIGNEPAPEYPDADKNVDGTCLGRHTQTRHHYVEVRDGEFQISMKVLNNHPASEWIKKDKTLISFAPSFDGSEFQSAIRVSLVGRESVKAGIMNFEHGTRQNFRFAQISKLASSDAQRIAADTKRAKHMGLLRVVVRRGRWTDATKRKPPTSRRGGASTTPVLGGQNLILAEEALQGQAISLGVTLSAPVLINKQTSGETTSYTDPPEAPYAVFFFKYRTSEELISEGVLDRLQAPEPEQMGDYGFHMAASAPFQSTPSTAPAARELLQAAPMTPLPETVSREISQAPVTPLPKLSHEEVLQLARDRLEKLPVKRVLELAGPGLGDQPFETFLQSARDRLDELSWKEIMQLAGERASEIKGRDEAPETITREGGGSQLPQPSSQPATIIKHEAGASQTPEPSSQRLLPIKREGEDILRPGAFKYRRAEASTEVIDLTED